MHEAEVERFMLIARTGNYKRHLVEARSYITKAMSQHNTAVYFSFGKDSLVCADIAHDIEPSVLIVNIDRGEGGDLEEAVVLYDQYAKRAGWNYHRVKTPRSIFQIYHEAGGINSVERTELKKNLLAGVKRAREEYQIACDVVGLRTEESHGRAWLSRYGLYHYSENEEHWFCKPVLNWSGAEIWAYIVSHKLPYLRWYDLEAPYVGYERARYSNWAGRTDMRKGRFMRLKQNYPDEFLKLERAFPEARKYI